MNARIIRISIYQVDLPLHEGSYAWSGGKSVEVFDSTVVSVETDTGITGWGEVCPLGPAYLPAYAAGARTGIATIAPELIGLNALEIDRVYDRMNAAMQGHPYVKSPIDVALWDILGQATKLPVVTLLGGASGDDVQLYRAISQADPDDMAASVLAYRSEGYRRFQLKVGGDPQTDIARIRAVRDVLEKDDILVADANTGWTRHDAMRVVHGVTDIDVAIEQPCATYEACRAVQRRTPHPFVLDESVTDLTALRRAIADDVPDVVNLKISKLGGLTPFRRARDLCVDADISMTVEDSWGGDIVTAAIAHAAHSTPESHRFTSTDFNSYVTRSIAEGAPQREGGVMRASRAPGLGIQPRLDVLGDPVAQVG
jgi:L-alanine-DL-glutamate epimerase-like enolase superfamily enzyme